MSIPISKKENKKQLREGDRIADFSVVKVLGHGGYGDIYLVKSRIHPDYLTRFAMKVEYPNKDNNNLRSSNAQKISKNQNDGNQNDNKNTDSNDNANKKTRDNDNGNNANDKEDQQNNENNNNNNENVKNNNKNRNRNQIRKSHLYIERTVLNALQDSPYFPRYISFGQTSLFRFLVMECFGPSLSTIKHVLPTGKYSLSSSLRIGIQMLRAIHAFHSHGFVHRDIKPSNFLIAASLSHPIILIDYGLARRFNTEKDQIPLNNSSNSTLSNSNFNLSAVASEQLTNPNASTNPNKQGKFGFAGTPKYASINAHENKELGRRDDLFSWFYSLLDIGSGSLPWSSLREKDDIYQEKKNANLDEFIMKNSLPKQLISIRILLESYSKTDEPDYDLIESFLEEAMRQNGSSWEDKYEWHRIDEESLSELSSITLKPPKGDKYIQKKNLPEPVLPSSKKMRRHKDHGDEDYAITEINAIASKTKPRRHTTAVPNDSGSRRNRTKSDLVTEQKPNSNFQHYAPQVDNQGRYSYFSSSEEKERYGHFGSDQLFSNSSGKIPQIRFSLFTKKAPSVSILASSNNNNNNNGNNNLNTNRDDKNTSSNKQKKYITTVKRRKTQRQRRNSDPRQPPSIKKSDSQTIQANLEDEKNNPDRKENSDQNDSDDKGLALGGNNYRTISTSNSIIFISHGRDKNDNDNDNDNNNNNQDDDSNSMYYTYRSYSSGEDIFNDNIHNSKNNSYNSNNLSDYYDSDSDYAVGEKQNARFSSMTKKKNSTCPAMEPKIDRNPGVGDKKNKKNCLIQ